MLASFIVIDAASVQCQQIELHRNPEGAEIDAPQTFQEELEEQIEGGLKSFSSVLG